MSWTAIALGVALLAANGFFVAAEFALLAARRSRMEQLAAQGSRAAVSAVRGLRELSLMLAGAQLGITMASFGLGAVAEPAVERGFETLLGMTAVPSSVRHATAFALTLVVVVFLHMVVGEMAPKSWAISDPDGSVLLLAPPFRAYVVVFKPFIWLLNTLANGFVRLWGVEPQGERVMVHHASDLALLVEQSGAEGHIEGGQTALLGRALELSGLDAESAMLPRPDIVAVPAGAGVDELERVASRTGRSRLPVYDGDLDHVLGILHVKDLLRLDGDERDTVTAAVLSRPALVTPESRPLEELMLDMREQRQHVAIVIDEYGSVAGLVSLEDCLEELIGEFEDESDLLRRRLRRRADGSYVVPAALRPDELRQRAGVTLPEGDWETVAGFVLASLGHVPVVGATVPFEGGEMTVSRMDGPRILELSLRVATPDADEV